MKLKIDYRKIVLFIILLSIFYFVYPICTEFYNIAADCIVDGAAAPCFGTECVTVFSYFAYEYGHRLESPVLLYYAILFPFLALILSYVIIKGFDKVKK